MIADSLGQRDCLSAPEPHSRTRDASRLDLFSHFSPRGDRVRSHPEPKSCERQAGALRYHALKTALLAGALERRHAVHSSKPESHRAQPKLRPRRLLTQFPTPGHRRHSQERQQRETEPATDELPHRLT
jgi:hypothetical protein